ncbi:hypothetical protein FGE12_24415 [Aggregicoccus sp. 17bor-14]|nr:MULTISPECIES: hypothetical protein [Myxococcaceae]MBF5045575.1 hypothetical protein [Simulacricoccus sp. 17bor-14]MRI91312.1 hypothetical protein [Aggregicoccus sp. 17bor-14]
MPRLALALLALAACAKVPPIVGDPAPTLRDLDAERAYTKVLERYSARGEIYALFDTRAFAGATFQAPAYREARVRRQAAFELLPPEKVQALLANEQAQAAAAHEFFFAAHVNDPRMDDFDKGTGKSVWRLTLLTPAGEVTPIQIRRIGRANLPMRAYYPYAGDFWVGYWLRFPRQFSNGTPVIPEGTGKVTLRVASTLGQLELQVDAQ